MDSRQRLEDQLLALEGVTVAPWKDGQLICVTYRGKEVGHFHGQDVLDLRLLPKIIREEGLTRDVSKEIHPDRTLTSRWIGVRFGTAAEVEQVLRLARRACDIR